MMEGLKSTVSRDMAAVLANVRNPPSPKAKRNVAAFVVTGDPESVKGVLETVHMDLKNDYPGAKIELRQAQTPYIHVEHPKEGEPNPVDPVSVIHQAQKLATDYIAGCPNHLPIFVELPPICNTGDFRIIFDVDPETGVARPDVDVAHDTPANPSLVDKYMLECSKNLYGALKKASHLKYAPALRLRLGQYRLEYFKVGRGARATLEQFENMVRQNRKCQGRFEPLVGSAASVDAVVARIQGPGSPCRSMDNQADGPMQETPDYILETRHGGKCFETHIDIARNETARSLPCKLGGTKEIQNPTHGSPVFEVTSMSIGRNLDWKMDATPRKRLKTNQNIKKFLEKSSARMQGSGEDFRSYPKVELPPANQRFDRGFESVAIKSVYRCKWKHTGYIIQFAIVRRWEGTDMMKEAFDTNFEVTVYANNWTEDMRLQEDQTIGSLWGPQLENLLPTASGDAPECGFSRVQGLISTLMDIRDFFEAPSRL